jgi:hypothetical protein
VVNCLVITGLLADKTYEVLNMIQLKDLDFLRCYETSRGKMFSLQLKGRYGQIIGQWDVI